MSRHPDSPTGLFSSADEELRRIVDRACARINTELSRRAPFLGQQTTMWMAHLSPTGKAPEYFLQPQSFPLLHLPWWAANSFTSEPDLKFMSDVIYSTINGYYYIRLLDNLMDGHGTIETDILPATAFFHTEFQAVYHNYFRASDPFWEIFRSAWFASSEAVTREVHLNRIDKTTFEQVAVGKLTAAIIPVAAVALRYRAKQHLRSWEEFTLALARFSQIEDDLSDWHHDLRHGKASLFLSEASRQKGLESISAWVVCKGFRREVEKLGRELSSLRDLAGRLHSPAVVHYLDVRRTMLETQKANIEEAFRVIKDVHRIIRPIHPTADHSSAQLKR